MATLLTGVRIRWGAGHQFGHHLGKYLVNGGIGPRLRMDYNTCIVAVEPNKLVVKDFQQEVIAGIACLLQVSLFIAGIACLLQVSLFIAGIACL